MIPEEHRLETSFIVDWYRARGSGRRIVKLWALGAGLLLIGSIAMGLTITSLVELTEVQRLLVGIVGFTMVVVGPLITTVGVTRMMFRDEEAMIILRGDGILFTRDTERVFVDWAALDHVECDDAGNLCLFAEEVPPLVVHERFPDIQCDDLAALIGDLQRKALMGILQPSRQKRFIGQ